MAACTPEQLASIHKMLNARSIAVIGASPKAGYAARFLSAVLKSKDRIAIYPVNPNYAEIMGVPAYRSVADLPEAPDLAAVLIPAEKVLDILQQCHRKGAGSALVISSGFAERATRESIALQHELGAFAKESGLRVAGPNCQGFANITKSIWATATQRPWIGSRGPVALVCQSGASAFGPFLMRAAENSIGFSHIITTGNEADLEFTDFVRYLLDDPGTRVIGGFVEGFKDPGKFIEVARLAAERGKPIVLIKIGRSDSGARAARSHTASLTGSDTAYDAVFRQCGVLRVRDFDELLETCQLLAHCHQPQQRGVAVISHSGGISSLTADMLGAAGFELPALTDRARDGIGAILKGAGSAANPADLTGFSRSPELPAIMDYMMAEPEVGTLVIASHGLGTQVDHVISLRDRSEKNVAFFWTMGRVNEPALEQLKSANIPIFYSPDTLAQALKKLIDYHAWRERWMLVGIPEVPPPTAQQQKLGQDLRNLARANLSEAESKQVIAAWGIAITRESTASSARAAVESAERLGYPVALKIDSADILHKTEAGGVRLNLHNAEEVRSAYAEITTSARTAASNSSISSVLVQEMVSDGVEVIVGVSYDEQLGPMLMFGMGGVTVEIYKDVALRPCPINRSDVLEMIAEVKGAQLLRGFRGKPAADIDALVDALVRTSHLALHLQGELAEFDINPLMVLPVGCGVKAVDALVLLRPHETP